MTQMEKRLVEEIKGDNIMTNREKAIACFAEYLKSLNNSALAYVLAYSVDGFAEMRCQHCAYSDKYNQYLYNCHGFCRIGIKKWLEQE